MSATGLTSRCGWLEKRADWTLVWNKRFFTLNGRTISYRDEENLPDRKVARIRSLQRSVMGEAHSFRLWTDSGDCWQLRAGSEAEYTAWAEDVGTALFSVEQEDVLEGEVSKRMAWTYMWQSRFVKIEGVDFSYRNKKDGPEKKKLVLCGWDKCAEPLEVMVRTTANDDFRLKMPDLATHNKWHRTVLDSMRRLMPNRWEMVVPGVSAGGSGQKGVVKELLTTSHHCASVYDGNKLLVTTGSPVVVRPKPTVDDSNPFVPSPSKLLPRRPPVPTSEVLCVDTVGEHSSLIVSVRPFAEGPGAQLRPAPRAHAASCLLNGDLFLHGGRRAFGNGETTTHADLWRLPLAKAAELAWIRLSPSPLPPLSSHTMSSLPMERSQSKPETSTAAVAHRMLVCGGFEDRSTTATTKTYFVSPAKNEVQEGPQLPEPRAGHAAVVADGVVFVLGGHTEVDTVDPKKALSSSILLLDLEANTTWVEPTLTERLPPLMEPTAAANGPEVFVFGGVASDSLPSLFSLVHVSGTVVVNRVEMMGSIPKAHRGISCHVVEDYLYVVGDEAETCDGGSTGLHRMLLPAPVNAQRWLRRRRYLAESKEEEMCEMTTTHAVDSEERVE